MIISINMNSFNCSGCIGKYNEYRFTIENLTAQCFVKSLCEINNCVSARLLSKTLGPEQEETGESMGRPSCGKRDSHCQYIKPDMILTVRWLDIIAS